MNRASIVMAGVREDVASGAVPAREAKRELVLRLSMSPERLDARRATLRQAARDVRQSLEEAEARRALLRAQADRLESEAMTDAFAEVDDGRATIEEDEDAG